MKFLPTEVAGAFLLELEPHADDRGFFARTYCEQELAKHDISFRVRQCNLSSNKKRGTFRGMHYSVAPYAEAKIVFCGQGAITDFLLDLRPESRTFGKQARLELSAANQRQLYIPAGVAHGFQTLEDNTLVHYLMSEFFHADSARGVRWNDPRFSLQLPLPISSISEKDQTYPDY